MKTDFYLALVLTVFFLIIAGVVPSNTVYAWRKVGFYLTYPTAGNFNKALNHVSFLGKNWSELFESHGKLKQTQTDLRLLRLKRIEDSHKRIEGVSSDKRELLKKSILSDNKIRMFGFSFARVAYRGVSQNEWMSRLYLRGDNLKEYKGDSPGLCFNEKESLFTLAGKLLKRGPGEFAVFELITSPDFAISVEIKRTGEIGLLRGVGEPGRLLLEFINKDSDLRKGDKVITTSASLLAPAGIPIGEIAGRRGDSPTGLFLRADVVPYMKVAKLKDLVILKW
ncbi:rod shape-determining protein MreC [Elusimicrobiota bacterium]